MNGTRHRDFYICEIFVNENITDSDLCPDYNLPWLLTLNHIYLIFIVGEKKSRRKSKSDVEGEKKEAKASSSDSDIDQEEDTKVIK